MLGHYFLRITTGFWPGTAQSLIKHSVMVLALQLVVCKFFAKCPCHVYFLLLGYTVAYISLDVGSGFLLVGLVKLHVLSTHSPLDRELISVLGWPWPWHSMLYFPLLMSWIFLHVLTSHYMVSTLCPKRPLLDYKVCYAFPISELFMGICSRGCWIMPIHWCTSVAPNISEQPRHWSLWYGPPLCLWSMMILFVIETSTSTSTFTTPNIIKLVPFGYKYPPLTCTPSNLIDHDHSVFDWILNFILLKPLNYVCRMAYHCCTTEQVQLQSLVMQYGIFLMILLWREKSKGNLLPSALPRPVSRLPSGLNFLCTFGVYGS